MHQFSGNVNGWLFFLSIVFGLGFWILDFGIWIKLFLGPMNEIDILSQQIFQT